MEKKRRDVHRIRFWFRITQGHQQDVGALSRLASLYNIAFATNRTTADMILTSPLWKDADYQPILPECINNYKNRKLQ